MVWSSPLIAPPLPLYRVDFINAPFLHSYGVCLWFPLIFTVWFLLLIANFVVDMPIPQWYRFNCLHWHNQVLVRSLRWAYRGGEVFANTFRNMVKANLQFRERVVIQWITLLPNKKCSLFIGSGSLISELSLFSEMVSLLSEIVSLFSEMFSLLSEFVSLISEHVSLLSDHVSLFSENRYITP